MDVLWWCSNESLIWVNIYEEDRENTINSIKEGIYSDVTRFYIGEHPKTSSKYCIIIEYAYK